MANFDEALKVVLVHEGGDVDNPNDPGHATRAGISLRFLKEKGIDIDRDGDIDADDVRALDADQIRGLYRQWFWNAVRGNEFGDQEMATKLFDGAVLMGPPRAIMLAQKAAGVKVDGLLGPVTMAALDAVSRDVMRRLIYAEMDFFRDIVIARPRSVEFLEGWMVRANCTLTTPCRTCRAYLR